MDERGRRLLGTFDDGGLILMTGRTARDNGGEWIFYGDTGCSTIDLCAVSFEVINEVRDFYVEKRG